MYKEVLERFVKACEDNVDYLPNGLSQICESDEKPIEEALKKQIPQKPKDIRSHNFKGFALGDCPVCDRTVDSNENYCFNCGQRLDWEAKK